MMFLALKKLIFNISKIKLCEFLKIFMLHKLHKSEFGEIERLKRVCGGS